MNTPYWQDSSEADTRLSWEPGREAEQTWNCPWHGSHFTATGSLIAGPTEEGLKSAELED
jgi:Rieske Fe-S protein